MTEDVNLLCSQIDFQLNLIVFTDYNDMCVSFILHLVVLVLNYNIFRGTYSINQLEFQLVMASIKVLR